MERRVSAMAAPRPRTPPLFTRGSNINRFNMPPSPRSSPDRERPVSAVDSLNSRMESPVSPRPSVASHMPVELTKPRIDKMYSINTKLRTMPSYSLISPRHLHSAHKKRQDHNSSLASINASIAYPEPGSTLSLGGRDGGSRIDLNRTHSTVSAHGTRGHTPRRKLKYSRAGSPAWTALDDYEVRTDIATGQTFACGGGFFGSPSAAESSVPDWPCSPIGEPVPAYRQGITGVASARQRRQKMGSSWMPSPPASPALSPSPPGTPRGRGPQGERVWTQRMDTRLRLDKSLQRDSALGCRIGMPGGSAQLSARTVPPLEQVLRWREKAEHDRLNPQATAARKARDARDLELLAKDRERKQAAMNL